MPQVTVYIRKQDLELWEALEKKSEFLSTALNKQTNVQTLTIKKGVNLCKIHNLPLTVYGKCLQKGCKYE